MRSSFNVVCVLIIVCVIGAWICFNSVLERVPIGYVGVRTQEYAILGSKGVKPEDFGPGWHRDLGPIDTWNLFDVTVQALELTKDPTRGDRKARDDVQIVSADGNRVSVDLTVKYRIKEGKAYRLYQDLGAGDTYKAIVRNESLDTFRDIYGKLDTEEFYDPVARGERTSAALVMLRTKLETRHVDVVDVLVRDVEFEERYEQKIRDKKLADQDVQLNMSKAQAAEMAGRTNVILKETEAMVKVISSQKEAELIKMQAETTRQIAQIHADAQKYVVEKEADADLYAAELIATGTLLEKNAEAEGEQLKATALHGSGGANLVALEATRNIELGDITVSTLETPFLELDNMVEKLGARSE